MTPTQLYRPAMLRIHGVGVVITPAQYPARITSVFLEREQPFATVRYFIGENAGVEVDLPARLLTPTAATREAR